MKQCDLCAESGVGIMENQHDEREIGADYKGGWMCDDCANAAQEEALADNERR